MYLNLVSPRCISNKQIFGKINKIFEFLLYSKTCLEGPLKNRKNKGLKDNGSLMKAKSIVECSLGAFCNTFDLH